MIAACLGGWRSPFGGGKEKEEEKEGKGGKRKGRPSTLGFQSGSFGFLFYLSLNFMFFVSALLWEWAGLHLFIGLCRRVGGCS